MDQEDHITLSDRTEYYWGDYLYYDFIYRAEQLNDDSIKYKDKTFIDYVKDPNIKTIIDNCEYKGNSSIVTYKDGGLINAFFANDLYKLSMAPVIHQATFHKKGCIVQFKIDLRTESTFNVSLKNGYVLKKDSNFGLDLITKLNSFQERIFDKGVIDYVLSNKNAEWKNYWADKKGIDIAGKTLIETSKDVIIDSYTDADGNDLTKDSFHRDSIILNCIPVPKDPTKPSTVVLSYVFNDGVGDGKPDIRATGYWPLCSWLETPLMQATYEVIHTNHLSRAGAFKVTYGTWMAEALYRTFSGMSFLEKTSSPIKVALFSGRRTGGALFNLLQVYLWNQFDVPFVPSTGTGRNLGTSSFWALYTLNKLGFPCNIQPSGTHAHELSMTLNVLYPDLDVTDKGFVGSQILGHLLYKRLSAGQTPTPMLTDTVGTRNFLVTALALKDGSAPALCSFATARQDSGELQDYKKIMDYYVGKAGCAKQPSLMASEIDKRDIDFNKAIDIGYALAGVGGALGDSEKIDDTKILGMKWDENNVAHFAASEAAKIARVWPGDGKSGYTLKTGDGVGKVTIDRKADKGSVEELETRAATFQKLHNDRKKQLEQQNKKKQEQLKTRQKELQRRHKQLEQLQINRQQKCLTLILNESDQQTVQINISQSKKKSTKPKGFGSTRAT